MHKPAEWYLCSSTTSLNSFEEAVVYADLEREKYLH